MESGSKAKDRRTANRKQKLGQKIEIEIIEVAY